MLILALVVVGAAAYLRLGVDRFPAVDIPQVRVRATLPGAAPEEMETEVAQRLEEAVNTVEGLDELRSISGAGATVVAANFELERDIDVAAQDVRDRVSAGARSTCRPTSTRRSSRSSTTSRARCSRSRSRPTARCAS